MWKKSLFLAGPLTGISYRNALDWRKYVESRLPIEVTAFSALRGKKHIINEPVLKDAYDDHLLSTPQGTITRDRYDVSRCDALFVNFLNATKVSIGTIMEMAWADARRIPVILAMEKGNIHDHPFIRQVASYVTEDLDEAIQTAADVVTMGDAAMPISSMTYEKKAQLSSIDDVIALVRAQEDLIFLYAREHAIDPLTLRTQLLLHVPRLVNDHYFPDERDVQKEMKNVAAFIKEKQHPYAHWLKPPEQPVTLSDLEFISLEAHIAKIYHENFHYVGSYRPGQHFALKDKNSGKIACIGSVASADLKQAEEKIASVVDPKLALVLSRFFAFRWAPENIFSYFHGKLRLQLMKEFNTQLMFSFINPNIGFDGRSHKAAHWRPFAYEEGTRYMYLDGRYRTMRHFVENYGTSDERKLKEKLGDSFKASSLDLHPLSLLAIPLQRRARKVIPAEPYRFHRPVLDDNRGNLSPDYPGKRCDIGQQLVQANKTRIKLLNRAKEYEKENIHNVAEQFSNLDKGDIFVYVSGTADPLETRPEDKTFQPIIAEALVRGATFLYVRPTERCLRDLGEPSQSDVWDRFDIFAKNVLSHLPTARALLCEDRLRLIQADQMSYFDIPGSKWDVYISDKIKAPNGVQGLGMFPAGGPEGGTNLHFSQPPEMAKILLKNVTKAIHEIRGLDPDYIPREIASRLDERAAA